MSEIIATFVLVLVVAAISSKTVCRRDRQPGWARTWWPAWSGASDSSWEVPRAMPSIRRAIWARALPIGLPIAKKGGSDWRYAPVPVVGPVEAVCWRG